LIIAVLRSQQHFADSKTRSKSCVAGIAGRLLKAGSRGNLHILDV
jgi:hypothetical protein